MLTRDGRRRPAARRVGERAEQAETIDLALASGLFTAVQATWNLHERAAGDALARPPRA